MCVGGGGYFVFSAGFCDVVVFVHHIAEERLPVFFIHCMLALSHVWLESIS